MDKENLKNHVIITKATIKKMLGCKDDYAYTVLNRLHKRGIIKKVFKSKYTTKDDPYIIAHNLVIPSYISFWSCSYLKGYTEQIVNTIQLATTISHKDVELQNYRIEFHKMPYFFGYKKIKRDDKTLLIADDEKLILDCILREELVGNLGELIKIIKKAKINEKNIVQYLKKINNKSLTKRTGFFLEKHKQIDISKKLSYKDTNYIRLSNYTGIRQKNKKWQVKYDNY